MGIDRNSFDYPWQSYYMEKDLSDPETHAEPQDESFKSLVEGAEHPLFSSSGLKNTINLYRALSNAPQEEMIEGEISEDVIRDMIKAAYTYKFPFETLVFAVDFVEKLDSRSSASDASSIAQELKNYATELIGVLGRQPLNSEILMAKAFNSTGTVKEMLDKAEQEPDEIAQPKGSEYDDKIFYKPKFAEKVERTNKEAYKYFNKRMILGDDVFPYFPLGEQV